MDIYLLLALKFSFAINIYEKDQGHLNIGRDPLTAIDDLQNIHIFKNAVGETILHVKAVMFLTPAYRLHWVPAQ